MLIWHHEFKNIHRKLEIMMKIYIVETKEGLSHKETTKLWQNILLDILKREYPDIELKIKRDAMGKPFVENALGCHFGISHSSGKIAIAVDVLPVGVDIERVREVNLDIVEHFFSVEDIKIFSEIPMKHKNEYFFKMWTQKESYVKCIGKGFSGMPFRKFTIVDDILVGDVEERYSFSTYDIAKGYKMSVCRESDTDISVVYLGYDM